jgi:hypothetical protein
MAMTLRLTDGEHEASEPSQRRRASPCRRRHARPSGELVARGQRRDRVGAAARLVMNWHAGALRRLGE